MRHSLAVAATFLLACAAAEEPAASTGAEEPVLHAETPDAARSLESPPAEWAVEERMARYRVPGVGIALIRGWEVEWAAGFGVRRAAGGGDGRRAAAGAGEGRAAAGGGKGAAGEDAAGEDAAGEGAAGEDAAGEGAAREDAAGDPVTTETLFQAASASKPVAAAGALRLVQERRLGLDEDVAPRLSSWKPPPNRFTGREPVTLRLLLSHRAGVTVHGFPGYAAGERVPTLAELLDGAAPANSPPVRVDAAPGSLYRYSGGGYQIVELLLEEVTGRPFHRLMEELVLAPFGMEGSTFEQPLPDSLAGIAAEGHGFDGRPIAGGWHTYPERAAAGLWTTPTDLARFAIGLMRAYRGEAEAPLATETARLMLATEGEGHGLGPMVDGAGNGLRFGHGGANRGFRAFVLAFPATGDGIAILANGDSGDGLIGEILQLAARDYGWPR